MKDLTKTGGHISCSQLRLATVDGVSLSGRCLLDRQERPVKTKKTFFQRLLYDFAFGCELFYPVQMYEQLGYDRELRQGRHIPK
ncbi:hypothetical protein JOH51_007283 [Rhizobium leguminosarum]|nr:hypothetical protein [Rhizobium leguminosarum]MBP2449775.1 hypothetical protein [Rhizobium leguminosarum]